MENQEWKKEVVKEDEGVRVTGYVTVKVQEGKFEITASGDGSPRVSCKRDTEEEMWWDVGQFEDALRKDLEREWLAAKDRKAIGDRFAKAGFMPNLGRG